MEELNIIDIKDMLKKTGDLYGDRPAYKFKTDEPKKAVELQTSGPFHTKKLEIW